MNTTPSIPLRRSADGTERRSERLAAVMVVGPPRPGKTRGYAIPALLDWPCSAVLVSVPRDVYDATRRARSGLGPVHLYDPEGDGTPGWDPVHEASSWSAALALARYGLGRR
jgi:type IV secretion system protein VirD4